MITVVMLKTETPGNVGAMARTMANFDLTKLILIAPKCNPKDEDAQRIAMHSKNILKNAKIFPYEHFAALKNDFDKVVATTGALGSDYNIPRTPLTPSEFAEMIDPSQKIALVFGNEGDGLTNEEIGICDLTITIPTSKKYRALNISHAGAILFYEIYERFGINKITSHIKKASRKEMDVLMERLNLIIEHTEFATDNKRDTQRTVWRKIMEQSMMSRREAFAAIGLLKKLEEKISKI